MMLKFCGLRRAADISYANAYPPDYIGFVFAQSRRRVSAEEASVLSQALSPAIRTVGVFVNAPLDDLLRAATDAQLSVIQLHGDEDADYIRAVRAQWRGALWKAVRVRTAADIGTADTLDVDALLLDAFSPAAYGGTGVVADFELIAQNRPRKPFFLAGGLTACNLPEAIAHVKPDGIDLSGGIETAGCKDADKMKQIHSIIKGC